MIYLELYPQSQCNRSEFQPLKGNVSLWNATLGAGSRLVVLALLENHIEKNWPTNWCHLQVYFAMSIENAAERGQFTGIEMQERKQYSAACLNITRVCTIQGHTCTTHDLNLKDP